MTQTKQFKDFNVSIIPLISGNNKYVVNTNYGKTFTYINKQMEDEQLEEYILNNIEEFYNAHSKPFALWNTNSSLTKDATY
jgi:hypothetical protein